MHGRHPSSAPVALLALIGILALSPSARAATFDFIYTDHVDVTLCPNGCGITLAGVDFGLIVNKGTADIGAAELGGTTFNVISSRPEMKLIPFVNSYAADLVAPVHPNEAVGSVQPGAPIANGVLTGQLHPGETLRNTAPKQFIAFEIMRTGLFNTYAGPVSFDVTMVMGDHVAEFTINADVTLGITGQFALSFPSAARVSSVPVATPVANRSWGALKAMYR